jgi:hypothetical protein
LPSPTTPTAVRSPVAARAFDERTEPEIAPRGRSNRIEFDSRRAADAAPPRPR